MREMTGGEALIGLSLQRSSKGVYDLHKIERIGNVAQLMKDVDHPLTS